jgi:polar amino acid transport system permease protein
MPLLTLVLIGYYVVFAQSQVAGLLDRFGVGSKLWTGAALLSVFTGAYLSEILRGGLESIPQGQIDSARAVGFDRYQVFRWVVMPQALRRVLPALAGQFVSLVKDSSLLSVIGVQEFTAQARAFNSATYGGIEAFLPLAAGYLLLTLPLAGVAHAMERHFRYQM